MGVISQDNLPSSDNGGEFIDSKLFAETLAELEKIKFEHVQDRRRIDELSEEIAYLESALVAADNRSVDLEKNLEEIKNESVDYRDLEKSDERVKLLLDSVREKNRRIDYLEKERFDLLDSIKKFDEIDSVSEVKLQNELQPIIYLEDKEGFRFESGSYILSDAFKTKLIEERLPAIVNYLNVHGLDVKFIDVIGHTDEQVLSRLERLGSGRRQSNMDRELITYLERDGDGVQLRVVDNVGLGMARAAAVVAFLKSATSLGEKYEILPYSAAQVIETGDTLAVGELNDFPVRDRRRIEIRFRGR